MIELKDDARVFVAGHGGLVGSAVVRRLQAAGFSRILVATREQLDLRDQAAVNYWFKANRPEYVFLVAGTVGALLTGVFASKAWNGTADGLLFGNPAQLLCRGFGDPDNDCQPLPAIEHCPERVEGEGKTACSKQINIQGFTGNRYLAKSAGCPEIIIPVTGKFLNLHQYVP